MEIAMVNDQLKTLPLLLSFFDDCNVSLPDSTDGTYFVFDGILLSFCYSARRASRSVLENAFVWKVLDDFSPAAGWQCAERALRCLLAVVSVSTWSNISALDFFPLFFFFSSFFLVFPVTWKDHMPHCDHCTFSPLLCNVTLLAESTRRKRENSMCWTPQEIALVRLTFFWFFFFLIFFFIKRKWVLCKSFSQLFISLFLFSSSSP